MDMCYGYWQIPLARESQEVMSIQTPCGVYTPIRILQGPTDAGNHFQALTSRVFADMSGNLLQWLDDSLIHSRKYGMKLLARKLSLFKKSVKFCGRVVDKDGVSFDPRSLNVLTRIVRPNFGGELQQFLCATNWMRSSIPRYTELISPLHKLMESIYKKTGKRAKKSVAKFKLSELWEKQHDVSFDNIKHTLAQSIKLAYPKKNYSTCVFSDASDTHWASMLPQIPRANINSSVENQGHEVLSFLSGAFSNSSSLRSSVEKEAVAVVHSMSQLDFLTASGQVHLYTDHENIIYIFDPYKCNPGISKQVANKSMRWTLKLSAYRYIIEYLPGEQNVSADLLTRWRAAP